MVGLPLGVPPFFYTPVCISVVRHRFKKWRGGTTAYIMILAQGQSVRVRPYGNSLRGIIKSGQLVELVPSEFNSIQTGDVVLVKWEKHYLLNKVIEIGKDTLLIGNNRGKIQGWVGKKAK